MPLIRSKPEQIVTLLRQIEVSIAERKTTPSFFRFNSTRFRPSFFKKSPCEVCGSENRAHNKTENR
jgi:hypothetical protein